MKAEYKPVLKTSLWSLAFLILYIIVLGCYKEYVFTWDDPTAEIRNVVLVGIGVVGIPFLILGHVTKRQDFETKRQDLNYRAEASVNEFLMSQVSLSAESFAEITTIDFTLQEMEFQTSRSSNLNDLYHYVRYDKSMRQDDILSPQKIDELLNVLWFEFKHWEELNKHVLVLLTAFRTKREFLNSNFGKILMINLASKLSEDAYSVLIFVLCLKEFQRVDLDNKSSDLSIAFSEIETLVELKIFSKLFKSRMKSFIHEFEKSQSMMRGRER